MNNIFCIFFSYYEVIYLRTGLMLMAKSITCNCCEMHFNPQRTFVELIQTYTGTRLTCIMTSVNRSIIPMTTCVSWRSLILAVEILLSPQGTVPDVEKTDQYAFCLHPSFVGRRLMRAKPSDGDMLTTSTYDFDFLGRVLLKM